MAADRRECSDVFAMTSSCWVGWMNCGQVVLEGCGTPGSGGLGETSAGDHADLRLRAHQSGFARVRAEADLLGVDECNVGQPHEAEQMAQIRFLEVDRLRGTFAVEAAARFDDDDALAAEQAPRAGLRINESIPGA